MTMVRFRNNLPIGHNILRRKVSILSLSAVRCTEINLENFEIARFILFICFIYFCPAGESMRLSGRHRVDSACCRRKPCLRCRSLRQDLCEKLQRHDFKVQNLYDAQSGWRKGHRDLFL